MEILSGNTQIELLKKMNDIKKEHDALKQEIIDDTVQFDEFEKKINEKIDRLQELEKNYVAVIEEMEKK
jgi:uncharacterized coiled-coil DUF342 family protein